MTTLRLLGFALWTGLALLAVPARGEDAPHFEAALEQARGGRDILVYLHGSDWCRLGEALKRTVWNDPGFQGATAREFVRVAIDQPEMTDQELRRLAAEAFEAPPPPLPVDDFKSEGKATLVALRDGTCGIQYPKAGTPAQDTFSFEVTLPDGSWPVLVLQGMPHPKLPNNGPGLANNGNFVVSKVVLRSGSRPIPCRAAWSDSFSAPPATAVDDSPVLPDQGWFRRDLGQRQAKLLIVPAEPLAGGTRMKVQLQFRSQWGQHILGCFRLLPLQSPELAREVVRWQAAFDLSQRNGKAGASAQRYPALLLYEPLPGAAKADGRYVLYGRLDEFELGSTPEATLAKVRELQEKRRQRDALLASAAQAAGPARATQLGRALDLPGLVYDGGFRNARLDEMKKADPADQSGYFDKVCFDPGRIAKAAYELAQKQDSAGAVAKIDQILAAKRNSPLSSQQQQRLMLVKFNFLRSWKGHEEERFAVCQEMFKLDPETYEGIGAIGYLMAHRKVAEMAISYGWGPENVKAGEGSWIFRIDTPRYFDHAGRYKIGFSGIGGKDKVTIRSVSLWANGQKVSEDRHPLELTPGNPAGTYAVALPTYNAGSQSWSYGPRQYTYSTRQKSAGATLVELHVDYQAAGSDARGNFNIEPLLDEPTP